MNKNQLSKALRIIIGLLALLALALTPSLLGSQNPAGQQQKATTSSTQCVPTPQSPIDTGTSTATPAPFEYGTPPLVEAPSVTPWPLSSITDLATDLPDEDKVYVYVFRCDGTFALFLVRPGGPNADISTAVPLQPGDVILDWIPPASLVGHYAPQITSTLLPPPPSTAAPYPAPRTPSETLPSPSPIPPYPPPATLAL